MRTPWRAALAAAALALLATPFSLAQGARAPLRLGVVAEEANEPDRMLEVYGEMIARLRERLAPSGVDVGDMVIARDLDDLSQRLARGEVEFVIETVFPTLVLQERSRRLDPALVVVRRGQREYRSVFFTRKEGPIRDLADLRGRTLVLQALRSTSAFALPKAELERAGLAIVPADDPRAGPRPRPLRARARRDQPGGLGAARQGRRGRLQRGRLGGPAGEDPLPAPHLPRDAADRPWPAVLPHRPRPARPAAGRGGAPGARRRRGRAATRSPSPSASRGSSR